MASTLRRHGCRLMAGLLVALGLSGMVLAAAPGSLAAWGYSRRITAEGRGSYVRIVIPDAVAAASRQDLADLRIADELGREVGYVSIPGGSGRPELVYFRAPEHQYRLLYGNPSAAAPAYGLELPAGFSSDRAVLGPQEANPFYSLTPDARQLTWPRRFPVAFYSVTGLVLLLIIYGQYLRAARVRRERRKIEVLLAEQRQAGEPEP